MLREVRTRVEPFSGPVLAGESTMNRTTENRTKSPVRTVVLDRTAAALAVGVWADICCSV
jgi:hypothetical protein